MRHHRWPSFIGALNSTRSSLNTTRRVYFYVIVKMWFKLPIYTRGAVKVKCRPRTSQYGGSTKTAIRNNG